MKMAKASEADLEMAMSLCRYLDDIERGYMPGELGNEDSEESEWLDERDCDQYARLLDGLRTLLRQGSIMRVVWGMAVVCDPSNKCIDPDADTIEHHPDVVRSLEQRDKLLAALNLIETDKDGDGFICREAMEQVREAIAQAEGVGE